MAIGTKTRRTVAKDRPSRTVGGGERRLRPVIAGEMDPRLVKRRRQVRAERQRRRRRRLIVAAAGVVILVVVGAIALSPLLGVRHVRISGNSHLDMARAENLVAIEQGTPLMRVDVGAVTNRLQSDPWVAHARVRRSFPTSLLIEVTEERPLMVLRTDQGTALVSHTGRILEFSSGDRDPAFVDTALPLVSMRGRIAHDSPSDADLPGRRGTDDVLELSRVVRNLPEMVESHMEHVDASDPLALELVMDDGSTVLVGPSEDVSAKMAALSAVLAGVDDRCVDRIDVRNPKRVTVTRIDNCLMAE